MSEEKWKLAEQTRKFNKMRPFEQVDYKKRHPNFEPVIEYFFHLKIIQYLKLKNVKKYQFSFSINF